MILDVLEHVICARCPTCGRVAWISLVGGYWRCTCERGYMKPEFHECQRIGWHAWPHRYLTDGRLLALEPLLDGWRLHVVASPWNAGSDDVYDYPFNVDAAAFVLPVLQVIVVNDEADDQLARTLSHLVLTDKGTRAALRALHGWSGEGEPEGWYRHRPSNRRRPGGNPDEEYVSR